ncbi:MAG TPA: hypothetical protein VEK14_08120 [Rhodomicrobium sp.]|nr:hypothetical protein [Rhodomicrobium sp.]
MTQPSPFFQLYPPLLSVQVADRVAIANRRFDHAAASEGERLLIPVPRRDQARPTIQPRLASRSPVIRSPSHAGEY